MINFGGMDLRMLKTNTLIKIWKRLKFCDSNTFLLVEEDKKLLLRCKESLRYLEM